MNFVICVHGREAMPVRSIPWVIGDWEAMTPDVIVNQLTNMRAGPPDLQAYLFEDGGFQAIKSSWWKDRFLVRLDRLQADIQAAGIADTADGYLQWQEGSIKILPAGVFVWKDEFERLCTRARCVPEPQAVQAFDEDDMAVMAQVGIDADAVRLESAEDRAERMRLSYAPVIPDAELRQQIMEGFQNLDTAVGQSIIDAEPLRRQYKQPYQEAQVLVLLVANGYNPRALPTMKKGTRWVKDEMLKLALNDPQTFSESSFAKTWERLRKDGRIADKSGLVTRVEGIPPVGIPQFGGAGTVAMETVAGLKSGHETELHHQ